MHVLQLSIYDGFDNMSPLVNVVTTKPSEPLVTSDWLLYMQMNATKDIGRETVSFMATITCRCSVATENSCGAHGVCSDGLCHCNDGYTGASCEIGPAAQASCDSCKVGYSCLADNQLPCWPGAVVLHGGHLPSGAWDEHFHQNYLGVYHRVASCNQEPELDMPVYRKDDTFSGPDGTKHPAFIQAQGLPVNMGRGWWVVGVNLQSDTMTFQDEVNCSGLTPTFATTGWDGSSDKDGADSVAEMFSERKLSFDLKSRAL